LWFCGSYAARGIPLLESGVRSAIAVARRLDAAPPWESGAPLAQVQASGAP
ncbi:MAG TPA: NAD/FAD-binding protein, partial [Planctomycetes bacterium]|nr:NAD/FAD-binding protein [Planctomycetota bacterium]